jgi:hypothetical protein
VAGPPLKHDRDLAGLRDGFGIKDADWADASEFERHLKGTVTVDDTSHLAKPLPVPIALFRAEQLLLGGVWSSCRLTSLSRNGCYVTLTNASSSLVARTEGLTAFTQLGTIQPSLLPFDGPPVVSTLARGTVTVQPVGLPLPAFGATFPPFYLELGKILEVVCTTVNTTVTIVLAVQEIP